VRIGGWRRATGIVAALILLVMTPGFVRAQPAGTVPLDGRIQELVDAGILKGAPDGDLQLDRRIQKGEFVILVERVIQLPASSVQRYGEGAADEEPDRWIRFYAWSRTVWKRVLALRMQFQHVWFDVRYRRAADPPWGLAQNHWMFTGLRHAYLSARLVDLSFKPMEPLSGSEAIDLILAAAGYAGEVAAVREQMPQATPDEARRVVCRQHDLERLMQYAGQPVTREDAAVMVWVLMAEHTGKH